MLLSKIKNFWLEILLFIVIFCVYLNNVAPAFTWVSYDHDLGDFVFSAKYGSVIHFPGFPIYTALSWIAIRIPYGHEGWRLAFWVSMLPAMISVVCVYLAVLKQTSIRSYAIVAGLALAGSNIFMSQSTIAEVYSLSACFITLTYTSLVYERYRLAAIFGGLSFGVHAFSAAAVVAMFVWSKDLRKRVWLFLPFAILPYSIVIIGGTQVGSLSMVSGDTYGFIQFALGALADNMKWWFSLPVWQVPGKIGMFAMLMITSFGVAIIPAVRHAMDVKKSRLLLACMFVPIIYFLGEVVDQTIVHLYLAVPFIAIAAGIGMSKTKLSPVYVSAISLALLLTFPFFYDIGNNLDETMSAQKTYDQLDEIPDGSIIAGLGRWERNNQTLLLGVSGREQTLIETYNKESERKLVPFNVSLYGSGMEVKGFGTIGRWYAGELTNKYGMATPVVPDIEGLGEERIRQYWEIIDIIVRENPDRPLFYSLVPENNPRERILTQYIPQ